MLRWQSWSGGAPLRPQRIGDVATRVLVASKREEEIAGLVATGMSNRDVADKLGLSPHTVKNFLFRIFEKLGISTRIELVLYVLSQDKPLEANSDVRLNFPDRESA